MEKSIRFLDSFYIRTKEGKKLLYRRRPAQEHFSKNKTGKDIILKARQLGFTTEIQLNLLEKALYFENITCATIAHRRESAEKIFRIGKFAWDNLDRRLKGKFLTRYDNVRELLFRKTGSNYFVNTEARGETIHHLHISEFAFITNPSDLIASTFEAVPKEGTITVEFTANGMNHAFDLWQEAIQGKNEFKPHFYNWLWDLDYTFTAPEQNEWIDEYRELARAYNLIFDVDKRLNLTRDQFYWYFLKVRRLKEKVKQEYPCTADEAFLASGNTVFDLFRVAQMQAKSVIEKRYNVNVYYEVEVNHQYIIGIDTAEGVESDSTAIEVLDLTDMKQVANLNDDKMRPDQAAEIALKLAKIYNNALIIPERNSSGLTTVLNLESSGYKNLFHNRHIDKTTKKRIDEIGWRTKSSNRDMMIDDYIEIWEDGDLEINSPITIGQMKTFIRKMNGKREHEEGKHDDSLFGLFLCVQGRKYQSIRKKHRAFTSKPMGF